MNKNSYPEILWEINFKDNSSQVFSKIEAIPNVDQAASEQKEVGYLEDMKERFEEIKREFSKSLPPEQEAAYLEKILNVALNLKSLFELIKELNELIKRFPPKKPNENK